MTHKSWSRWVVLALLLSLALPAPLLAQVPAGFGRTPHAALRSSQRFASEHNEYRASMDYYNAYTWRRARYCPRCLFGYRLGVPYYYYDGFKMYRLSDPYKVGLVAGIGAAIGGLAFQSLTGFGWGAVIGGGLEVVNLIVHHGHADDELKRVTEQDQQEAANQPPSAPVQPTPPPAQAPTVASQLPDGTVIAMPNGQTEVVHGDQLVTAPASQGATIRQPPAVCDASDSMIWAINESKNFVFLAGVDPGWLDDPAHHIKHKLVALGGGGKVDVTRLPPHSRLCVPLPELGQRYKVVPTPLATSIADGSTGLVIAPEDWRDLTLSGDGLALVYRPVY